jgi:proteasome accessory factor C
MTSPKTAHRLTRILSMLPWVIVNPGATVHEVCDRFGYTPRELAADLDLVFVCGLPGYGPGDLMVAYIDEDEVVVEMADYFSAPLRLSPPEALSLLASGMALLSAGEASEALQRAVDKLQAVVLPDAPEALVVDLSEPDLVAELKGAAARGEVMHISHMSMASGVVTERDIEPWSVFSTLGNWYVSAYCRSAGGERVFRIDRIRAAAPTGETFRTGGHAPPPVVAYSPGEDDARAVIRLEGPARWVADYYPVEVLEDTGTTLTVRFSAADPLVTARLLLRLGDAAELLEGDEVAAAHHRLRARILARYGTRPGRERTG